MVADGLDECDPHRVSIAAGLSRWAASHPHTRVCVLTRPIGHSPALLPNFSHAELLPLENWNIRKIADWMIASQVSEPPRAAAALSDFMNAVEERNGGNVASIAARNPLLLSFLVRLFLDGQPIHGKRTALFQRIIELIRQTPSLDRKLVGPIPDQTTAWAAAEQAGWSCIDQPNRPTTEVYTLIAAKLGGGIDARRRAEFAVYQWTEHGLMEQLKVGSLDALVFVHLALGEYLAGRHLAQLDTSTLAQAIEKYRRKAKWREPILLAAGAGAAEPVIGALLSLDSPGDPTSTEALLAAAAIAESDVGAVSESTVQSVAERLKSRVYSIVPLISIEAGLGLIDLAPLVPELVASVAVELRHHDQPWTRLSALCAGLSTGSTLIPIEEVVQWIEQFSLRPEFSVSSRTGQWFSGTHDLQRPAIAKALRRVAEELPATTAEHIIVSFLSRKDLSISMVGAARAELTEEPYKYWVARASVSTWGTSVQRLEGMSQASERWRAGNVTIFKCILVACGREQTADPHQFSEYRLLGELLSSMGYWELEMPDLAAVTEDHSDVLLAEVLRGMISGLGLDAHRLGDEANAWLNSLLKSSDEIWPPHGIKREPHANAIIGANLDLKLVASAMHQTSWFIAWNAARLFEAIIPAPNQPELLRSVLLHGRGRTLWLVGLLAGAIWGSEAFETIHERLGMQLSAGCGYLYEPMILGSGAFDASSEGAEALLTGI